MSRPSSGDYKYAIEELAAELASRDGAEYLDLTADQRFEYYAKADQRYWETQCC